MLPVMTGLAATEYIMAFCPTPILIVSASTNRGELFKTYDALTAGAVDVLEKPRGDEAEGVWEAHFVATVRMVARIRVITHPRARLSPLWQPPALASSERAALPGADLRYQLVALGTSTGGPSALLEILRAIPPGLPVPIVILLHIDEPFGTAFADWLDSQSPHAVSYAREGEPLEAASGRVVMAPPGRHLVLQNRRFRLTDDPPLHSCRPSVDVLFDSLAREMGAATVASLMTGMGRDGAAGLLRIRRAGGFTIAQDEASSVVYGMPREAALLGAAERILPLSEIGAAITQQVSRR
jgi:two-component system chemotaxis response regulator CheB